MNYEVFKKKCKEKGYSACGLVTELGISKSNITNWKNGGNPSVEVLIKIAQTLECSVGYLLGTEDESGNSAATVKPNLRNIKETSSRTISLKNSCIIDNKTLMEIAAYANCSILFLCGNDKNFIPALPNRAAASISQRSRDKILEIFDSVNSDHVIANIQMQLSVIILHNLAIVSPNQIPDNFLSDKANYILNDVRSKDLLRNYPFNISDLLEMGDLYDKSIDFMISGITNVSN